jgi:hypothetical protein
VLVIRAVTGLYPDTVLLDGNRGRSYESLLRVHHRKAVFVHCPDDGQAGSYRFVRRVSIDKRPCVYRFNSTCLVSRITGQIKITRPPPEQDQRAARDSASASDVERGRRTG